MTQIPRASHPINSGGLVDRVWYDFLRQLVAQIGTTTNATPQAQELAKIFPGAGITVSGNGTPEYPYIISLGAGSAAVVPNTSAGFVSDNPTLGLGVIGWETNTGRIKFGDDATDWNSLTYFDASALPYDNTTSGLTADDVQAAIDETVALIPATTDDLPEGSTNKYFTDELAQDAVGGMVDGTGDVPLTYTDATPKLAAALSNTGVTAGSYTSADITVDAKGRITAAANGSGGGGGGGSSAWSLVKKTSDEARNNTTTPVDDSQLTLSLAASTRYRVRFHLLINQANATMDLKCGINYTGTTVRVIGSRRGAAPTGTSIIFAYETSLLPPSSASTTSASGTWWFDWEYIIETDSAGTLSFQWAQNTSNASNLTVYAGSYIEYGTM